MRVSVVFTPEAEAQLLSLYRFGKPGQIYFRRTVVAGMHKAGGYAKESRVVLTVQRRVLMTSVDETRRVPMSAANCAAGAFGQAQRGRSLRGAFASKARSYRGLGLVL